MPSTNARRQPGRPRPGFTLVDLVSARPVRMPAVYVRDLLAVEQDLAETVRAMLAQSTAEAS